MGDPRRTKNKYKTPIHPWEKLRLDAEKPLMKEYGLVNKKELWKISSKLKNFKDTAKKLVASKSEQANIEKKEMVKSMNSYGLIHSEELDEILGLEVEQLLDRRLQTIVFKKGLARSIKQARQMITHRHIAVNNTRVSAPSYLVKIAEEDSITFMSNSNFVSEDHPERSSPETTIEKPETKKETTEKSAEEKVEVKEESKPEENKEEKKESEKVKEKKPVEEKVEVKEESKPEESSETKKEESEDK